jgi:hypothetical protein
MLWRMLRSKSVYQMLICTVIDAVSQVHVKTSSSGQIASFYFKENVTHRHGYQRQRSLHNPL